MQRLFHDDKMIRPMVDVLPSSDVDDDEPMMVLKPFEQTLWEARHARPMTTAEIKWIMEGVMLGLGTIYRRGLVHTGRSHTRLLKRDGEKKKKQLTPANFGHWTDLKMENVGITGFDDERPNLNTRDIIVRLADCACGSSKLGSMAIYRHSRSTVHLS